MVDIRKQMDVLDARAQEMENSIEMIAKYVKREVDAVKQTTAADIQSKEESFLKAYSQRIENAEKSVSGLGESVKAQLDAIKKEIKESQFKLAIDGRKIMHDKDSGFAKIAQLESRLNDETAKMKKLIAESRHEENRAKVAEIEDMVSSVTFHMEDQMRALRNELEDSIARQMAELKKAQTEPASRQIDERLNEEFVRLDKLISDSNKSLASRLEKKLNNEIGRIESLIADSNKVAADEIEQKFRREVEKLEDLIYHSGKALSEKGMEQYVEKIAKMKSNFERFFNVKSHLLETKVNELSQSMKRLESGKDFLALEERVAEMQTKISNEMEELRESGGDIKSLKDALNSLAPDAQIVGHKAALKSLREKIDLISSANPEGFREQTDERLAAASKEIAGARARLEESMKKISLDFTYKINQMKRSLDEEAEKFKNRISEKELHGLRKELEELRTAIDSETVNRLSLEKGFQDIASSVKSSQDDSLTRSIEEEAASRLSLEKKLEDLASAVADLKNKYHFAERLQNIDTDKIERDIESFNETTKNIERNTHLKTMELITQQIHAFAKSLDRRLPELVTREEMLKMSREAKQPAAPQNELAMALRIENLEKEISNLANMMNSMHGRIPFVVE
jgi:DNA repair exonuclease SbcCD ATPase subunit